MTENQRMIGVHPLADMFPKMADDEFETLCSSIAHRGLVEPIWLFEDQILDGRHRHRACGEAGVAPRFETYEGDDPVGFVVALNLERRHLTVEQRAALGVAVKVAEAARAKDRQGTRTDLEDIPADLPESSLETSPSATGTSGDARDIAGAKVGVSGKLVDQAEKIAKSAPDVAERMKAGSYGSVAAAAKVADLPAEKRDEVHRELDKGRKLVDVLPGASRKTLHSSHSNEWYTPEDILEEVRTLFGGNIDLDPASCPEANETVQAGTIFTKADDGLEQPWFGRVFCNPPYGLDADRNSNQGKWSASMRERYLADEFREGVLLVNAATGQKWFQPLWHHWVCVVYGRLKFSAPKASKKKDQPTHGSVLVYFGPQGEEFERRFSKIGRVVPPLPELEAEQVDDSQVDIEQLIAQRSTRVVVHALLEGEPLCKWTEEAFDDWSEEHDGTSAANVDLVTCTDCLVVLGETRGADEWSVRRLPIPCAPNEWHHELPDGTLVPARKTDTGNRRDTGYAVFSATGEIRLADDGMPLEAADAYDLIATLRPQPASIYEDERFSSPEAAELWDDLEHRRLVDTGELLEDSLKTYNVKQLREVLEAYRGFLGDDARKGELVTALLEEYRSRR